MTDTTPYIVVIALASLVLIWFVWASRDDAS